MGLGSMEIVALALIAFVLFGANRLPDMMQNLGKGIRSFKEGLKDDENTQG